eukprot:9606593-Alexandrium_andersonii.AAC.1
MRSFCGALCVGLPCYPGRYPLPCLKLPPGAPSARAFIFEADARVFSGIFLAGPSCVLLGTLHRRARNTEQ